MIQIKNLKKSFGKAQILNGVDLEVQKGKSLVIIGRSGTGKSVLLKCILGLEKYDCGTIKINNKATKKVPDKFFYNQFGMLFQGGALFDSVTIWENVSFKLLQGADPISKSDARAIASEKLKLVGLSTEIMDQYPSELSGGMQKRVALARAISGDPEIIFFDEPTTGLDPIMANIINLLIREIVDKTGVTAITITHDINSTRTIGDEVALLDSGIIQWSGEITELDNSKNKMVAQFINGNPIGPISNNY
jgi:phospholipid/cholesterol/gamma-HCH transport system ATP-binding protein